MQEKIFDMLFNEDEITWQSIIYDLVKTEQMDPWDIDISLLTKKFLQRVKKMKEMDLRISGKIILAAVVLLKIKSKRFMEYDLTALDALIASTEDTDEDQFFDELEQNLAPITEEPTFEEKLGLFPRVPQPRKRKVSVFDLVESLEKALEVQIRRKPSVKQKSTMEAPEKGREISLVIKDVYERVLAFFGKKSGDKLTFSQLIPSESKEDKVFTLIPLLHLDNQRKVDLFQPEHFGDIEIDLLKQRKKSKAA